MHRNPDWPKSKKYKGWHLSLSGWQYPAGIGDGYVKFVAQRVAGKLPSTQPPLAVLGKGTPDDMAIWTFVLAERKGVSIEFVVGSPETPAKWADALLAVKKWIDKAETGEHREELHIPHP